MSWDFAVSADDYRKLIHHLPVALWQVDTRGASSVFDRLKAEGVSDIAGHLDRHPALVELAKDIVCVTAVNREAVSLFRGTSAADLVVPVRYLLSAMPDLAKRVMVAHFEGRRNYIEETKVTAFDGTVIDVLFTVTYPERPGHYDSSLITMLNIGERLKTETQLRQLQADFTHAARISTLGELATSIAHEVKQPLSAIVTNAETTLRWLKRDDVSLSKLETLTSRVISNARRASDIVQRIRGMAMEHEPERTSLDLNRDRGRGAAVRPSRHRIAVDRSVGEIWRAASQGDRRPYPVAAGGRQSARQQRSGDCTGRRPGAPDRPPHGCRWRQRGRFHHSRQRARYRRRAPRAHSSTASSPPRTRGWAWAWPSASRSSSATRAPLPFRTVRTGAPSFGFRFR